jgi:hypothetical protein
MASISASIPQALATAPLPPESSLAKAIGIEALSSSSNHSNSTYALAPSHGEPTSTPSLPQPPPEGTTGSESFSRRYRILERLDRACLNLAPSFFSINMGTGITSILVHDLPYNAGWLRRLGDVIFVVNIVVFILLAMGNVVRYARFKGLFASVNNHLVSGMFWGCLPMGFATIVVSTLPFMWILVADTLPEHGRHRLRARMGPPLGPNSLGNVVDRRCPLHLGQFWYDIHDVSFHNLGDEASQFT